MLKLLQIKIPMNQITDEERKKQIEYENYQNKKIKNEKKKIGGY
jgi:hypothetical protein